MNVVIYGIPIIMAITLHEAAHGYVALVCGDDTAKRFGRLTLNPLKHVDPVGTILLPSVLILLNAGFVFGYAKPVPVNFAALRHLRRDAILVAAAGPITNFILALFSGLLVHFTILMPETIASVLINMLKFSILINIVLGAFNLFPLPPLDGGRIAVALLPQPFSRMLARVEPYGFFILIGTIFLLPIALRTIGINFSPFHYFLQSFIFRGIEIVSILTGLN